jgi:hypothetical protein
MEEFKLVAVRQRRRAGNPSNFLFNTEFPHTSHTATSPNIYLLSDKKTIICQNCYTLSLFYRELWAPFNFITVCSILARPTALLLRQCILCQFHSRMLLPSNRADPQSRSLLNDFCLESSLYLRNGELLITISKTHNFHVKNKTVI